MTTRFRRPMLMLGVTILIMQAVFMPVGMVYAETTMDTEEQEQVELPPMKNYLEDEQVSDPSFFFTRSRMQGRVEEPLQVTFFSDQEVSEARVFLPEEATLLQDQLPTGISVEEGAQLNEWIVQSKRAQNTFVLPLVVEKVGNYEVSVEETTAHIEILEQEEAMEEVLVEKTESPDENPEEQENLKEDSENEKLPEVPQKQHTDEEETDDEAAVIESTVFDGETAEVSTIAQFREAVANPDIGTISILADLTESVANNITLARSLLIKGNGHQVTFNNENAYFSLVNTNNYETFRFENISITKIGLQPLVISTVENSSPWSLELENVQEHGNNLFRLASIPLGLVHFTGDTNNFISSSSYTLFIEASCMKISNNAKVNITRGSATIYQSTNGDSPKLIVQGSSVLNISTASGANAAINLQNDNSEIKVSNSKLAVTTQNQTAINLQGEASSFSSENSKVHITTTYGKGIELNGKKSNINFLNSDIVVNSNFGQRVNLIGNDSEILIHNSFFNLEATSNLSRGIYISGERPSIELNSGTLSISDTQNTQGIILDGTEASLNLHNQSEVKVIVSGLGNNENIQIGNNKENPTLEIHDQSKLTIVTDSDSSVPTDISNNALHLRGINPTVKVSSQSELSIEISSLNRRGLYLNGSNPNLEIIEASANFTTQLGQSINLNGIDALMTLENDGKIKINSNGSGSTENIQIGNNNSNPRLEVKNNSIIEITTNSDATLGSITGNNALHLRGESPKIDVIDSVIAIEVNLGNRRGIVFTGKAGQLNLVNSEVSTKTVNGAGLSSDGENTHFEIYKSKLDSKTVNGDNISQLGNESIINVVTMSEVRLDSTSGRNIYSQGNNNELNISSGSLMDVNSVSAISIWLNGSYSKLNVIDKGTEVLMSSSVNPIFTSATLYLGTGTAASPGAEINISKNAYVEINSNLATTIGVWSENAQFNLLDNAELLVKQGASSEAAGGAAAAVRFMNFGSSKFTIDNSKMKIEQTGGLTPGMRMFGNNNSINVKNGGDFTVYNPGNGIANDGGTGVNNQGISYSGGVNNSFTIDGLGSSVQIIAKSGPALDMGTSSPTIDVKNGGIFKAEGRTLSAEGGIFRASVINVTFDNPLYMNFQNNRPGGGNIFNVANGSALSATNSDLAVWKNGSDLTGEPDLDFRSIDYSFSGTNFNTLGETSDSDLINTSVFGTVGLTAYSRLSSNNARWAIVDELRIPTNADKHIYGRVSLPVGLDDSRPAWTNEAEVTVEVEKEDGDKTDYTAKTVGHSDDSSGISIYGEEPRGGLFEIALDEPLEAGTKIRIIKVELASGELTDGFEHQILTETIEVFPIIPPTPAQFSSSIIAQDSSKIQGMTDNIDAEVTATHNGEPLDIEAVTVYADGRFTLDLSEVSLEMDDEIQVFLRDAEGSALTAGVVNPPETNNTRGNINPSTELTYHDVTFEPAATLIVGDLGPVSPVDPLDPEVEVNPENKPEMPEDQGQLSIDFVSSFNFDSQAISVHNQTYYAKPQRLLNEDGTVNETEERPNYIQISDRRPESERNGWDLAVTQKEQFKGEGNQVLNGASLSLLNQQVITAGGGTSPILQTVNELVPGNRQTLLEAQGSEGTGTWIYRFGDGETAGESVTLKVPRGSNPEATTYSTTLIWELSAVPGN